MTQEQLAEYNQMRQEILARATMHHQQLVYAVGLQFVGALFLIWLVSTGAEWPLIELFLLAVPIAFAGLAFNYQANQATMESVAKYLNQQYGSAGLKWEEFFGREKAKNQLISFAKALPMVWVLAIPLVIWSTMGWPADGLNSALLAIDLVLVVLVLINFKYKVGK